MTKRREPLMLEWESCDELHGEGIARSYCNRLRGHLGPHGPKLTNDDRRWILSRLLGPLDAFLQTIQSAQAVSLELDGDPPV